MQLAEAIFSGIRSALGAVPEPEGDLRRRRAPRFHVDREISIKPSGVTNAACRAVNLSSISAFGICIVDRLPISSGDQFIAILPLVDGTHINVLCTARQSRLTSTGGFRVGAEFTSELERDARFVRGVSGVMSASDPMAKAADPGGDLRQPATLRRTAVASAKPVRVEVRKFAQGIFELISPQAISLGEQVVLEFRFQQRVQAWKCTSVQLRAESSGLYHVSLHNDGPANMPPKSGVGAFIKRLFSRA